MAVNLSPLQFQSGNLQETLRTVLAETGLAPNRLQLEVTEGVLIRNVEETFAELGKCRALGIQILMDDFGTGYSSLSYFQRFCFDKVKIDKSFTQEITTSQSARAVIRAVISMSQQVGMGVVAEGVETEAQMIHLLDLGCTHVQGFLFSPAVAAGDIAQLLKAGPWLSDTDFVEAA